MRLPLLGGGAGGLRFSPACRIVGGAGVPQVVRGGVQRPLAAVEQVPQPVELAAAQVQRAGGVDRPGPRPLHGRGERGPGRLQLVAGAVQVRRPVLQPVPRNLPLLGERGQRRGVLRVAGGDLRLPLPAVLGEPVPLPFQPVAGGGPLPLELLPRGGPLRGEPLAEVGTLPVERLAGVGRFPFEFRPVPVQVGGTLVQFPADAGQRLRLVPVGGGDGRLQVCLPLGPLPFPVRLQFVAAGGLLPLERLALADQRPGLFLQPAAVRGQPGAVGGQAAAVGGEFGLLPFEIAHQPLAAGGLDGEFFLAGIRFFTCPLRPPLGLGQRLAAAFGVEVERPGRRGELFLPGPQGGGPVREGAAQSWQLVRPRPVGAGGEPVDQCIEVAGVVDGGDGRHGGILPGRGVPGRHGRGG